MFVNLYNPQASADATPATHTEVDEASLYGPSPYDINFAFPLQTASLEGTRVRLTPFVPRVHAKAYWDAVQPVSADLFRYFGLTFTSLDENLAYFEKRYRQNPEFVLLAVIDKSQSPTRAAPEATDPEDRDDSGESLAGVIGLLRASPAQLTAEIGFVIVFPAFQRTHIAAHAVGLLLRYCLDLPSAPLPGLGLRRVQWMSLPQNIASLRLAEKMGFKKEGVIRWMWVLGGEEGNKPRPGDPKEDKTGWDTVMLAMCWDDWEEGGRAQVQARLSN
ncbi:acyl-CoA N-acyltransferase [Daedalea quercina L-15889]|uniref:Acyl-CoA N-acyltransferase n=1 Tax=Daedalea quercina L-15889 TaxID=1314783 RepID=A0A165M0Y3_9APHY|nr:acyl-CoA N-acyltransferase [Daedalea quercina L-15889]